MGIMMAAQREQAGDGHHALRDLIRKADGHRVAAGHQRDGGEGVVRSAVAFARVFLDDADHGVAFDELALATNGLAEDRSGEAVEVAHGPGGGLVQERNGVGGEELAVAAGCRGASVARSRSDDGAASVASDFCAARGGLVAREV